MKTHVLLVAIVAMALAIPSMSQVDLYDNGQPNGTVDAWTINFGFIVSDTFTLGSQSDVNGLNFAAWLFPGDVLESAELSITSSEFGGTTFFDGVVNFNQSNCTSNQFGFNVCQENGSFNSVNLGAGTYWLNLQNAVVNTGDPVYWDENGGPSLASENSLGSIPSESFTVLGGDTTTCWGCGCSNNPDCAGPEPGSLTLSLSGVTTIFGVLAAVRRRIL
jgi:hypothetical protein